MAYDKIVEYIVKAKDVQFSRYEKESFKIISGVLVAVGICIFVSFFKNSLNIIVGIIMDAIIFGLAIFINNIEYSIEIKDKRIRIKKWMKEYELDYTDLINVRKVQPQDSGNYIVFEYLSNNKLKRINYTYGLKDSEMDEICSFFITNKQLTINPCIYEEYIDINRNVPDEFIIDTVESDNKKTLIAKIIIIVVGILIFCIMLKIFN